jgi:hypothetical protein
VPVEVSGGALHPSGAGAGAHLVARAAPIRAAAPDAAWSSRDGHALGVAIVRTSARPDPAQLEFGIERARATVSSTRVSAPTHPALAVSASTRPSPRPGAGGEFSFE